MFLKMDQISTSDPAISNHAGLLVSVFIEISYGIAVAMNWNTGIIMWCEVRSSFIALFLSFFPVTHPNI